MIFVFGSNKSGIHGAGSAKFAHQHYGAEWGIGEGITGGPDTLCYALPTKGKNITFIPLSEVKHSVNRFLTVARYWKDAQNAEFKVTQVGCGLGGFTKEQIAPLFEKAPDNCFFDTAWLPILGPSKKYWGTF